MLRLRLAQYLQFNRAIPRPSRQRRRQPRRAGLRHRQRPPPGERLRQLPAILPAQLPAQLPSAGPELPAPGVFADELPAAPQLPARPVRGLLEPLARALRDGRGWTRYTATGADSGMGKNVGR